jgi:hypothetical protein
VAWVRRAALPGGLVLIRRRKRGRKDRTPSGQPRQARRSRKNAHRNNEPWLLIASVSLQPYGAQQIVILYKTRMPIEENFRDTKSVTYGLGIANEGRTSFLRAANLLLMAALALFVLWLIGCWAKNRGWTRAVRVNSSSRSTDYSTIFLARQIIQETRHRLPPACLYPASRLVQRYLESLYAP